MLGLLDDLVIVPLGLWLALRLIPAELMAEYRALAGRLAKRPTSRGAAIFVIALWLAGVALAAWIIL